MIRTKKYFDRGDYVLEVDSTSGVNVSRKIPKISSDEAKARILKGELTPAEKTPQPKGPGAIRRAANYAKAQVKHVAAGRPKATLEVIQERFAICPNCPSDLYEVLEPNKIPASLRHLAEVGKCLDQSCGCYIHPATTEPAKLARADSFCPRGHWGAVTDGG